MLPQKWWKTFERKKFLFRIFDFNYILEAVRDEGKFAVLKSAYILDFWYSIWYTSRKKKFTSQKVQFSHYKNRLSQKNAQNKK